MSSSHEGGSQEDQFFFEWWWFGSLKYKTLTGQRISLTDYLWYNNKTSLCAAEFNFSKNKATVQGMQCSNFSLQDLEMNGNRKGKLQYTDNWHYGIQPSSWFSFVQVRCDRMLHKKLAFESMWAEAARDVSYHISNTALFLAYRAISQLEKTLSRERGGLILSFWSSPNSNKTSPSHVKMLIIAACAWWWQRSTCLWRSTKADFDIWDDKQTHTLRSSNRHFKIVSSAQTWCSGLNQRLWSHI